MGKIYKLLKIISSKIKCFLLIINGFDVKIGKHTIIENGTRIRFKTHSGKLIIGDYVTIGRNCDFVIGGRLS